MLFEAGLINRRGTIEEKNTVGDFYELEQERGNSIFSKLLHTQWRGYKINIIDTPGLDDFIGELISSLRVADTAVMLLNSENCLLMPLKCITANTTNIPVASAMIEAYAAPLNPNFGIPKWP